MTPANQEIVTRIMQGRMLPEHAVDMITEAEYMNARIQNTGDLPAAMILLILVTAGVSVRPQPAQADPFAQPQPQQDESWMAPPQKSPDGRASFGVSPG